MRSRIVTIERLEAVARAALLGGYGQVQTWRDSGILRRKMLLDLSMDCHNPYEFEMSSNVPSIHGAKKAPYTLVIKSRCRKCAPCRERKRMFWAARAMTEWRQAPYTLFGTLTFSPENDAIIDARARLELARTGVDFDNLTADEIFRTRVKYAGAEVTKWLKRLRNSDPHRRIGLRYLLVAEAHASGKTSELKRGRPHFHCLFHQAEGAQLVISSEWARKPSGEVRTDKLGNPLLADGSFLKRSWQGGFSTFALCRSAQAASYVCKYLTKEETSTRVRASFRYGASEDESSESEGNGLPKREVPTIGGEQSGMETTEPAHSAGPTIFAWSTDHATIRPPCPLPVPAAE